MWEGVGQDGGCRVEGLALHTIRTTKYAPVFCAHLVPIQTRKKGETAEEGVRVEASIGRRVDKICPGLRNMSGPYGNSIRNSYIGVG